MMQRRKFIKDSGVITIAMGVFGSIHWKKDQFVGDSPTTTDILGPFYRPGAPLRKNLNPPDFTGEMLHFSGTLYKEDGKTPMSNCLIEIWQCQEDMRYDNVSDDFSYRAAQKTGTDGKYHFITAIPIPYPNEEYPGEYRPAHIHMRISSDGQQDLITQIYLNGDPYLQTDRSIKSQLAVNRVLSLKKISDKESELKFDIVLKKEFIPEDAVYHKITGIYRMSDKSLIEFYRDGDFLFYKWNNQIRDGLSYTGDNTFVAGTNDLQVKFELQPKGNAKVQFHLTRRRDILLEGTKVLNYSSIN